MKDMANFRETPKVTPMVIQHWEYKFERAIQILIRGGYTPEKLIEKIKELTTTQE